MLPALNRNWWGEGEEGRISSMVSMCLSLKSFVTAAAAMPTASRPAQSSRWSSQDRSVSSGIPVSQCGHDPSSMSQNKAIHQNNAH